MAEERKCPRCGSVEVVRSRRSLLDHLLFVLKPFRCRSCHFRFYSLDRSEPLRRPHGEE
jgi:transposase-like protein